MPFRVEYDAAQGTLRTHVWGILTAEDAVAWEGALEATTDGFAPGARFQVLEDLTDYEVADQPFAVHQRLREVSPRFLARHGFAVGFWRLYEATPPAQDRPGTIWRVAHVHHDRDKMERYTELLASATERFFHRREDAEAWLAGPP